MKRLGVSLLLGALGVVVGGCSDEEQLGLGQGGAGAAQAGQSGRAGQGGSAAGGGGSAGTAGSGGTGGAGTGGSAGTAGNGGAAGQTQGAPAVTAATFTENKAVPLAGTLAVTVDRSAKVRVGVDDGQGHTFTLTTGEAKTEHTIPVLELRTGRTYTLTVTAFDDQGDGASIKVTRVTAPLPADFPPLEALAKDPSASGLTLFPVGRFQGAGSDASWSYVIAVDSSAEVVWYFQAGANVSDVRLTSKGDVRTMVGETGIIEGTTVGEPLRLLAANNLSGPVPAGITPVALDTIHHDTVELPNGHLLALSTETKKLSAADCPNYDKEYTVVGDVVAEIDPATGQVVHRTSLFDLIDPCRRVDADFKSAFWAPVYGANAADWTHANSVFYDAASNRVLVSSRHQDWVIGYRYAADDSGPADELLFRFGAEGDFTLSGDGALFPYHQHAAKILSNGHLMVFDNGTSRPGTLDTDVTKLPRSRGVEYELTTTGPKSGWQAKQVWEFGSKDVRFTDTSTGSPVEVGYYAPVIGDSDLTPANTVLITTGALMSPVTGFLFDPTVKKSARVVEVTHDDAPKVVMDLRIEDKAAAGFKSYLVYRADRIATLYPASSGLTVTRP